MREVMHMHMPSHACILIRCLMSVSGNSQFWLTRSSCCCCCSFCSVRDATLLRLEWMTAINLMRRRRRLWQPPEFKLLWVAASKSKCRLGRHLCLWPLSSARSLARSGHKYFLCFGLWETATGQDLRLRTTSTCFWQSPRVARHKKSWFTQWVNSFLSCICSLSGWHELARNSFCRLQAEHLNPKGPIWSLFFFVFAANKHIWVGCYGAKVKQWLRKQVGGFRYSS